MMFRISSSVGEAATRGRNRRLPSRRFAKIARRPISRVLSLPKGFPLGRGWPFIWDARRRAPRATDPGDDAGTRLPAEAGVPPLFGLAPGGVYRAAAVAGGAVVSYTTVSPLPRISREIVRRYAFCCTVPGVAPAGRYPAPCSRGARTFLAEPEDPARPSGHLAAKHVSARWPRVNRQRQGRQRHPCHATKGRTASAAMPVIQRGGRGVGHGGKAA